MKLIGAKISARFALIGMLVIVFVLGACSTGNGTTNTTTPDQPATEVSSTDTQSAAPTEIPTETQLPTETPTEEPPVVSFSGDVMPILESRCIQCHGGEKIEGELIMLTYDQIMAGGEDGVVVVPGDSDNSLMAQLLIEKKMPKRGPKLTPAQTELIVEWINQGALNN